MSRNYCQPVVVVPVVFGASEVVSKNQKSHLEKVPAYNEVVCAILQKAVILGIVNILIYSVA